MDDPVDGAPPRDAHALHDLPISVVLVGHVQIPAIVEEQGHRRSHDDIEEACLLIDARFLARLCAQMTLLAMHEQLVIRHRAPVMIALYLLAADAAKEPHLLPRLDALCQCVDADSLGHHDDRCDNLATRIIEVAQELHVDLELIEMVILEHIQGRVSATKIIEPDRIAIAAEAVDHLQDLVAVLHHGRFRDLDAQVVARQLILPDDRLDL